MQCSSWQNTQPLVPLPSVHDEGSGCPQAWGHYQGSKIARALKKQMSPHRGILSDGPPQEDPHPLHRLAVQLGGAAHQPNVSHLGLR